MAEPEILPADLRFKFQLNRQLLASITINNPLDKRLAFKIKTTAPKKYVVRPSSGLCEARGSLSVQVIMQAQKDYPPDFQNCKDKFMVQTTTLDEDEQPDKDTFDKDKRGDVKETRLRVILEGPAAPPSPVPEASENEEGGPDRVDRDLSSDTRTKTALADAAFSTAEVNAMRQQLERAVRERDELRKKMDMIELQGAAPASRQEAGHDPALKFRVTIIHIILVAILAFIIGHYT